MADRRNVAHNKKVIQEKQHEKDKTGRRPPREKKSAAPPAKPPCEPAESTSVEHKPADLEKSIAILSKLKEMEFHSRANIEALAELTLTIEEELKQREFSEPLGALYSAQDTFQARIAAFIPNYEAKCDSLK